LSPVAESVAESVAQRVDLSLVEPVVGERCQRAVVNGGEHPSETVRVKAVVSASRQVQKRDFGVGAVGQRGMDVDVVAGLTSPP